MEWIKKQECRNEKKTEENVKRGSKYPLQNLNRQSKDTFILDKPEMILLLATYGAMTIDPVCEEGKNIMEYAQENNSILAQAQIIIIRA